MWLTTDYLRKNIVGTGCGTVPKHKSCLSNSNIIKFIDDFFGGFIVADEFEDNEFMEGIATIVKQLTLDQFKYWSDILSNDLCFIYLKSGDDLTSEDIIEKFTTLTEFEKKSLIADIFSSLIGKFGGSIRIEFINDEDDYFFIESE
jgi:hypothetical protein